MKKGQKYPVEILTPEEVNRIITACSGRAPTGIRNRALVAVLYRAGLRIGETLDLRPKDLDRERGTIRILHGKGDKARTVGMDPAGFALVERWLDKRATLGINGRSPVFCTLKGGRMEESYVRQMLIRKAKKAGIEKRVHPHGFRHTFACELRKEGVDIKLIQQQLGHRWLSTTARYLQHLEPGAVVETMAARTWEP